MPDAVRIGAGAAVGHRLHVPPEEVTTRLLDIQVNVGRTGRVTPSSAS